MACFKEAAKYKIYLINQNINNEQNAIFCAVGNVFRYITVQSYSIPVPKTYLTAI